MSNNGYINIIKKEIKWCKAHPGESASGKKFEAGFIAGLQQALYSVKQVNRKGG